MEAFTTFAMSQGLRVKEFTVPAAATPIEVLRRFNIVLDLAENDKSIIFYSFNNKVFGLCSCDLSNIPTGLSRQDMMVIKMALAPSNEDRSLVTWIHQETYMAGHTGQDLSGFCKWLGSRMSVRQCCVCYERCPSGGQGCTRCISWVCGACIKGMGRGGAFDCPVCRRDPRVAKVVVM